ncbi:MAG TPA: methylated-DNA--[protein]-cysteine S-methyltransferase [Chitinophagales bacterium]
MNSIYQNSIETPLGKMIVCAVENGICLLEFGDRKELQNELQQLEKTLNTTIQQGENTHIKTLKTQLHEYFAGTRKTFDIPLFFTGTEFQKSVWNELLKIPYGKTRSYKEQAIALGNLESIRAVANANGRNKIAILVPCHRVIGTNGSLTGYAGGLQRKQFLLELESGNKIPTLF